MSILVNKDTRLLVQGITGKAGAFHSQPRIRHQPRRRVPAAARFEDKVPVFDTVSEGVRETGANASVIFVPPAFAADSILEAIDAEIPLVVCITR